MKVENSIEEIAEVDEDRAIREIKRELADEDRKEYMSRWFAKDLEILVYYIEKLRIENKQLLNTLTDYKRVLKENEYMHNELNKQETTINKYAKENKELKQDRNNNYQMIALAQNEMLGYMQGYEDGKKLRRSAVASIVENQQYYIVRKQMEKYEEHIKKLQKENEELKNQEATQRKINELLVQRYSNSIPIQKVKDIIDRIDYDIKKTKEIISKNTNIYASYRKNDYQIVRLKAMNTKSLDIKKRLQKLLESEE